MLVHSTKNEVVDFSTPCVVILQEPPRQAEGKGVKRSEQSERSSQSQLQRKQSSDCFFFFVYRVFGQRVAPRQTYLRLLNML